MKGAVAVIMQKNSVAAFLMWSLQKRLVEESDAKTT